MNKLAYCRISAVLFMIVALAHLTRLMTGWPIQVNGVTIPLVLSLFGFIVPGGLAFWGLRESRGGS